MLEIPCLAAWSSSNTPLERADTKPDEGSEIQKMAIGMLLGRCVEKNYIKKSYLPVNEREGSVGRKSFIFVEGLHRAKSFECMKNTFKFRSLPYALKERSLRIS